MAVSSDALYLSRYDVFMMLKIRMKDRRIFIVTFGVGVRYMAHVKVCIASALNKADEINLYEQEVLAAI